MGMRTLRWMKLENCVIVNMAMAITLDSRYYPFVAQHLGYVYHGLHSILFIYSANHCDGVFKIDHAVSIHPKEWSMTGVNFTVICEDGYSLSETDTNHQICNEDKEWKNKPQCMGNGSLFSIFGNLLIYIRYTIFRLNGLNFDIFNDTSKLATQ